MRRATRTVTLGVIAGLAVGLGAGLVHGDPVAAPRTPVASPERVGGVPDRTEIAYVNLATGERSGTPNQFETRAAQSLAKLFIAADVLKRGDLADFADVERMIRFSDDRAADWLDFKYPGAINRAAADYHLTSTFANGYWGDATTSAADVATFLSQTRPDATALIRFWMSNAAGIAADGTVQNWGTARLPGAVGNKWAWSDGAEPTEVASATLGFGYVAVAITNGNAGEETDDVLAALG